MQSFDLKKPEPRTAAVNRNAQCTEKAQQPKPKPAINRKKEILSLRPSTCRKLPAERDEPVYLDVRTAGEDRYNSPDLRDEDNTSGQVGHDIHGQVVEDLHDIHGQVVEDLHDIHVQAAEDHPNTVDGHVVDLAAGQLNISGVEHVPPHQAEEYLQSKEVFFSYQPPI